MPKLKIPLASEAPSEAREWFDRTIRTEGLRIAYETLKAVCNDPDAPAPAKATAGVALMRAAGAFEASESGEGVPAHEMTPEQLNRAAAKAIQRIEEFTSGKSNSSDET